MLVLLPNVLSTINKVIGSINIYQLDKILYDYT